jgi:hypothetical protein
VIVDVLIVMLILLLCGSLPVWPYSRAWGYAGSAGIGVILLLVGLLVYCNVL